MCIFSTVASLCHYFSDFLAGGRQEKVGVGSGRWSRDPEVVREKLAASLRCAATAARSYWTDPRLDSRPRREVSPHPPPPPPETYCPLRRATKGLRGLRNALRQPPVVITDKPSQVRRNQTDIGPLATTSLLFPWVTLFFPFFLLLQDVSFWSIVRLMMCKDAVFHAVLMQCVWIRWFLKFVDIETHISFAFF